MTEASRRPAIKEYAFRDYKMALEAYLTGSADEFALQAAYEFGRRAAHEGLSLLQFSELHHAALRALS